MVVVDYLAAVHNASRRFISPVLARLVPFAVMIGFGLAYGPAFGPIAVAWGMLVGAALYLHGRRTGTRPPTAPLHNYWGPEFSDDECLRIVTGVIQNVTDQVATIAAAIEEQSVTTRDIAANLGQASAGVREANSRVSQTSNVTRDIARDISDVDRAAGEIAGGKGESRDSHRLLLVEGHADGGMAG